MCEIPTRHDTYNLARLRRSIDVGVRGAFDFMVWREDLTFPDCGSIACIGGHAEILMLANGYKPDYHQGGMAKVFSKKIEEFLGLTGSEAKDLFFGFPAYAGKEEALAALDWLIAHPTEVFDWKCIPHSPTMKARVRQGRARHELEFARTNSPFFEIGDDDE